MINKFCNILKKEFKNNFIFYLSLLFIILLFVIKLDYVIYSPGGLENLEGRIEVENAYKSSGSLNLTYVTARDGSLANILLSYIIPSWDLESLDDMRIENESADEINERNKIYLKETSYDAIIAAFNETAIAYSIENINVYITYIYEDANTSLKVGDIIKSIDGMEINNLNDLKNIVSNYKENDKILVKVLRDNKEVDCYSYLINKDGNMLIGIAIAELKDIKTSPKVSFVFKDNESGSSRGLMCALDIYNKITEFDLTKGKKISGTGSIDENGNIGSISGVKYKLIGAVKKKADIFIVPEDNYAEALKYKEEFNYDITILKGSTLNEVINLLKEL